VENLIVAKVGTLFGFSQRLLRRATSFFFIVFFSCFLLFGCASSVTQRDAASNMDKGVQNARDTFGSSGEIAEAYQNANQATKGAVLGGAAGAVTGSLTSGLGIFPGTLIGAIMGASYGSYIDANTSLKDRLENRGATVVVLGDQILIVLPSAHIFHDLTPNIKPQAYSTLDLVVCYINSYTKMLVKIAAYTDKTGCQNVDLALSQQQADSVAKFLLASGIDARVLYAEGYGGTYLVQKSSTKWDESDNYRIEITLEKLYV